MQQKSYFVLVLALCAGITLSGCGGGSQPSNNSLPNIQTHNAAQLPSAFAMHPAAPAEFVAHMPTMRYPRNDQSLSAYSAQSHAFAERNATSQSASVATLTYDSYVRSLPLQAQSRRTDVDGARVVYVLREAITSPTILPGSNHLYSSGTRVDIFDAATGDRLAVMLTAPISAVKSSKP